MVSYGLLWIIAMKSGFIYSLKKIEKKAYKIKKNDLIKFGKVMFRVIEANSIYSEFKENNKNTNFRNLVSF